MVRGVPMSLRVAGLLEGQLLNSYFLSKLTMEHAVPSLLETIAKRKANAIYKLALKNVPAYQKFMRNKKYSSIEKVPYTDKKNYVKKYSYEERCVDGIFPKIGHIEESSGSSGASTNWIRSLKEESGLVKGAAFEVNYIYDIHKKNYIVLSAWSSGPWATGLKFCELLEKHGLVKNTTADIDNIARTLKQLGTKYNYLIAGYPPFLKNLLDSNVVDWKKYKIDMLTGGESSSVEWKRYMRNKLGNKNSKIISSYGASDVDIGIGFETPLSEFIRELSNDNPKINQALFGMSQNAILFQYNPLMHYIENTKKGEFTITLLDPSVSSPKIKYNLHDRGGTVSYNKMINIVSKHDRGKLKAFLKKNNTLKLPFLYIAGRIDGTISIGGNNIYPEQVWAAIQESRLASKVNRFMIGASHDKEFNVRFDVQVELKKRVRPDASIKKVLERDIMKKLLDVNLEYKEYYHNHKSNQAYLKPKVTLHAFNTAEVFKAQEGKIKNKYIIKR